MRKLKLDVQDLNVESFSTLSPAAGLGTVQGQGQVQNRVDNTLQTCVDCAGGIWSTPGETNCCPGTWRDTCNASCFFTECVCHSMLGNNTCVSCYTCENLGTCGWDNTCVRGNCGPT